MATRIQVRRDLAANWTSNNPTLASGEIGLETDTRKWKIGNGSSNWISLEYQLPSMTGSWASTPDENVLQIDRSTKRVGINAASLLHALDVGGTFRATGNSTIGGTLSVTGNTTLSGDLAVNAATNADITTTTSTATVFNTNATTLNIGGAATTVGIGAATGTATINNATTAISGLLNLAGNLNIATNKFNVTAASGNTAIAGTLSAGATTLASLGLTTDLAVADGGTGASDASGARTNLGLGSIATQEAGNVSITGGSITGITDLAIADGGTGASTAAAALAALINFPATLDATYSHTTSTNVDIDVTGLTVGRVYRYRITQSGQNTSDLHTSTLRLTHSGTSAAIYFGANLAAAVTTLTFGIEGIAGLTSNTNFNRPIIAQAAHRGNLGGSRSQDAFVLRLR